MTFIETPGEGRGLVSNSKIIQTELNIPPKFYYSILPTDGFPVPSLSKRIDMDRKTRSKFSLFLPLFFSLSLPSLHHDLDTFAKVSTLDDTLKFEAHPASVFDNLVGTVNFELPPCYTTDPFPMTRELLGSPLSNPPPSPLPRSIPSYESSFPAVFSIIGEIRLRSLRFSRRRRCSHHPPFAVTRKRNE